MNDSRVRLISTLKVIGNFPITMFSIASSSGVRFSSGLIEWRLFPIRNNAPPLQFSELQFPSARGIKGHRLLAYPPHLSTTSLRAPTHTLPTLVSRKKMSIDAFPVSGLRLHQLRASQKEMKKVRQTAIDLTVDPGDGLLWPSRGCRDEVPLLVSRIKSSAFMQIS